MIKYNDRPVERKHFPDGTLLMKQAADRGVGSGFGDAKAELSWYYENDEELVALYFLTKHLQGKGISDISLKLPYIPNARQDRVKKEEDIFTLKYFCQLLNGLGFSKVTVLDPHSYVSEALIDRIQIETPKKYVQRVLEELRGENAEGKKEIGNILFFYPDEGAMKRYSAMFDHPYVFGIKERDWTTGKIQGLSVFGQTERIPGSTILIIDDICSKGGTFYHSAKALKELGAGDIYLYVSHCENTVLEGELIGSGLIEKIYTTNSIFTKMHEKVEVFEYV